MKKTDAQYDLIDFNCFKTSEVFFLKKAGCAPGKKCQHRKTTHTVRDIYEIYDVIWKAWK